MGRFLSTKEINFLKENYLILGTKKCANILNKSDEAIRVHARKLNFFLSREKINELKSETSIKNFIPRIDINILKNVTIPEVAYVLGLLWADGWISNKNEYSVNIKLVTEDFDKIENIFYKIADWKKYTREYKKYKQTTTLRLSGKLIVDYLISIGYKTKSFDSANLVLDTIPENLRHYWWRGYFDGDGYINKNGNALQLCSGITQDWSFVSYLPSDIKYRISKEQYLNKKSNKLNSCSKMYIYGPSAKLFTDYIYCGKIFGFERKYIRRQK